MKLRVYYEDTDAGGVVYHANYLKFCERARSEIFFQKNAAIFDKDTGHFLLTKAECNFLKPAKLGDILEVKTHILKLKKASVIIKQEIYKDTEKLFEANFTLAFVKAEKIALIDDDILKVFATLEKE
ncbi:YbgC/FadM family acyl-CoA thioesterase [Campylobacter insulaenigrae]|uniref:Acyl-CoA thioesterase n=1 Tax=Campylobacter insulaenigrae NCTC 12927 TaxID=1031564 RepID=A0A0A8H3K6_9BACT|nr:YbgC/FadM family acyl-CoA thioesterase [Campylobacter insulaenigrae]AJC87464.1 acyl-CoA thioesterase [Campylobacter insulaenigrae NCTC 12927]MCR6570823.1 YbgC/FadM family acyl-CoA thioesterase [Campylobacter insulaenigrae]MCR6572520.1 YbgC/FadM family acyl-CoA thioesterase [Campylobacter insulaenigrae]MCR6576892.1 YbgC/FadM family acyl-CoA thioesterase [Campylobacter insulaenigrae]MCR6578427.1 YbgC/FadM family acyl-CoA thioesterase [Campylobacter insulaenigrae]